MEAPSAPVSQALVFLVGIIGATLVQAISPAIAAIVGIGTISERRRKKQATEMAPDISAALQKDADFEAWVKDRAAHALKQDITIIRSLAQSTAETLKVHGEQIANASKTSSATAIDVAYIRGRMEGK